jgi:hypothetical protein
MLEGATRFKRIGELRNHLENKRKDWDRFCWREELIYDELEVTLAPERAPIILRDKLRVWVLEKRLRRVQRQKFISKRQAERMSLERNVLLDIEFIEELERS